jgi:succinate dehydrogenase / fumarate reductase cytochrome b subunit
MTRSPPSPPAASLPAAATPSYLGMWTWLAQRASSVVLMVLLPWHWVQPYSRPVRLAVLFFVVVHAAAGMRVLLADVGIAARWPRGLVWALAGLGLLIFLYFAIGYV